ncbi:MAG: MBL fold metallo-hydrolase [Rhodospirillaceae bacterium]|jgi:ribonuclease Z|nr:MBL fold metallo-hydrolase [Rhodospirillaceae bacterium]MBT5565863.1 MBL fold metallo-hydrolase [Rhodospirillaceae bacterium]MBT6088715.1 MBL fold metallo-hydrolase [Rhodospirillaceae bacterium]MBT6961346.1 MBL fold metallo-hydrolase [Rhodospirillaceae bacterium]
MAPNVVRAATLSLIWLATFAATLKAEEEAPTLKATILGSGYVEPLPDKYGASILVEAGSETLLFDVGRGTTIRLNQIPVGFDVVDKVFLTHLHSDHVVGLPDLYLTGWVLGRRDTPLHLWGPTGTAHMARHLVDAFDFDITIRRDKHTRYAAAGATIDATNFTEGVVYEANGVIVTAFTVDHGPVQPAFGFRVDYAGRSLAISGDTRPSDNLIAHTRDVDVLFHEAFAPEAYSAAHPDVPYLVIKAIESVHTTPTQAGEIFAAVNPRLAVFYHIDPGEAFAAELRRDAGKAFRGALEVGEDLMSVSIGDEIKVQRRATVR